MCVAGTMPDLDSRKITELPEADGWRGGRWADGEVTKASLTSVTEEPGCYRRTDRIWGPSQRREKEEAEMRLRDGVDDGTGCGDGVKGV